MKHLARITRVKMMCGVTLAATGALLLVSCGSSVAGSTYIDNGGVVQIEFKSDGKAYVSTGPVSNACIYTQNGKTLTLSCNGDKTVFTVDDDGALNGPPNGFLSRLTKKK
jgi:hypothetical protein